MIFFWNYFLRNLEGEGGKGKNKRLRDIASEMDFDAEAHKVFQALGLKDRALGPDVYRDLDQIYCSPSTGSTIYVGNQTAAQEMAVLKAHKISYIINWSTHSWAHLPTHTLNLHPIADA